MGAELVLSCPAPTDRERIWAAIRVLREFTRRDITLSFPQGVREWVVKDYVTALCRAGIVVKTAESRAQTPCRYRLVEDRGVNAPRVGKGGALLPPSGRNRMWKAMRILKTFTARELAQAASLEDAPVAVNEAEHYCGWLCRGGYLRDNGKTWSFIPTRNSGPKAPQILRVRQLYDPNTDKIVYSCRPEGRDDE